MNGKKRTYAAKMMRLFTKYGGNPQQAVVIKPRKEPDDTINATEAAKLLQCSYRTLLNMVRDGKIPGVKIGRSYQFSRNALQDWHRKSLTESRGGEQHER